jgi:hypothetical protein
MHNALLGLGRFLLVSGLCWTTASARTLTAADGRAVEVEILGFEGLDKVRFKRADSGQVFTVPITAFSEPDQKVLGEEAAEAAKPPVIRPGDLALELSRSRFTTRKSKEDVPVVGGGVIRGGLDVSLEDWGYTFTLRNSSARELKDLRAEYVLFAKLEESRVVVFGPSTNRVGRAHGRVGFETLPAQGRIAARSEGITLCKTELKGTLINPEDPDGETRDQLEGVWVRIYRGDEMLLELASPPELAAKERWPASKI